MENTTNIRISGKPCDSSGSGFSFFNVTNLTIESVQFSQCGWRVIPEVVTKYVRESKLPKLYFYLAIAMCLEMTLK
jgi:hypothetical protein